MKHAPYQNLVSACLGLFFALLLFPVAASAGDLPFDPTIDAIQTFVFDPSCAFGGCHGAGTAADLDLRPGASHADLVNQPSTEVPTWNRVTPFDPDGSYLICKLEECDEMAGLLMPFGGTPLEQNVIDVIRLWIQLGAPDSSTPVEGSSWGEIKAGYAE